MRGVGAGVNRGTAQCGWRGFMSVLLHAWVCWSFLVRAIDASAVAILASATWCWPGALSPCPVSGGGVPVLFGGCRPYGASARWVRGLWISCRWVKPDAVKPLGDPPGSGGESFRPKAVFTLGRRRNPLCGWPSRSLEICGTGGYIGHVGRLPVRVGPALRGAPGAPVGGWAACERFALLITRPVAKRPVRPR